jgi:hypothetical protein
MHFMGNVLEMMGTWLVEDKRHPEGEFVVTCFHEVCTEGEFAVTCFHEVCTNREIFAVYS